MENVRRHTMAQLELGHLRSASDPDDDRINRLFVTETGSQLYDTVELVNRLGSIEDDAAGGTFEGKLPYDVIIAVLLSFIRCYSGAMRVQAIKRELLIHRATLQGRGTTITELANQTSTPLETVRRSINESAAQGDIRFEKDPDDDRKTRVFSSDPEKESQRVAEVIEHLSRVGSAVGSGLPSTVTRSPGPALAGPVRTLPFSATRPASIQASASRREHRPARAISFAMRSGFRSSDPVVSFFVEVSAMAG